MNYEDICIPPWISCHTYLYGQPESRTYISNEKSHAYVLLEGLASDMWKMLCDHVPKNAFLTWAEEHNVADQAEDFLNELSAQGLITFGKETAQEVEYEPILDGARDDGEESKFVEEMQSWLMEKHFMFSLFFELTYRCNLKCVHCYNPKDMPLVELDFETCKKAIDDAYNVGCFRITFSGGESTLHSCFLEIVRYARSKHISVEIFTNGQRLADEKDLYESVLNLYPYRVCVSLYSTDKITHERVTSVEGSFEKTISLIERLRKDNVNVQIKNFLLNFNCFDCIGIKKFAQRIGATSVADISLIPTIDGDKKTFCYLLDEETLFRLFSDEQSPLFVGKDFDGWRDYEEMKNGMPCLGGFTGLCVNPRGEVTICVSMPLGVGNLNTDTVDKIWRAATKKDENSKLYQWQKTRIADFKECFTQDYCRFCDFCPGMGYLENGYLKKSDVLCSQARAKMKAYVSLQEK